MSDATTSTQQQAADDIPRKVAAAGALFLNAAGEVLLVNPTYKPVWEIPGGVVELFEAPRTACIREVEEEIGLHIEPGKLLGLDYVAHPERGREVLRFIFWGGVLSREQVDAIRLPAEELSEFGFFTGPEARRRLSSSLGEQVNRLLTMLTRPQDEQAFVYTEHLPSTLTTMVD